MMRLSLSSVLVGVVIGVFVLGQDEALASRPGENGDRHFRKSDRGPGILTDRLERRKIAREERREKVLAATEESSSTFMKSTGKREAAKVDAVDRKLKKAEPEKRREGQTAPVEARTVRETRRGPGRAGKGAGPVKRRRVVLKPLFGN